MGFNPGFGSPPSGGGAPPPPAAPAGFQSPPVERLDTSSYLVAEGAKLACSMGSENEYLKLTTRRHRINRQLIGNVEDHKALRDIVSFGNCKSMANPTVFEATTKAGGVLKAMPCVPPVFTPWQPGSKYVFQDHGGRMIRVLTSNSICACGYAGVVTIENANTHVREK